MRSRASVRREWVGDAWGRQHEAPRNAVSRRRPRHWIIPAFGTKCRWAGSPHDVTRLLLTMRDTGESEGRIRRLHNADGVRGNRGSPDITTRSRASSRGGSMAGSTVGLFTPAKGTQWRQLIPGLDG